MLPAPRGVSPVAASFFASLCQGIHRVPFTTCRLFFVLRLSSLILFTNACALFLRVCLFSIVFVFARLSLVRRHDSITLLNTFFPGCLGHSLGHAYRIAQ